MTSRKLAFTALALVLPLAAACAVEPDVEDIDGPEAETACVPNPEPILIEGNPTCADLGYEFEAKVDFPSASPHTIDLFGDHTITFTHDGYYVDWSSTLGIDVVLVKGGNAAFAWRYIPEAFSGENLYSPLNDGGNLPEISHVNFCYDYEVEVEKTATTSFERAFGWDIDKVGVYNDGVFQTLLTSLTLSPTETFLPIYLVKLFTTGSVDSDWAVGGTITVTNPAPIPATVTAIGDMFGGATLPVTCPVALPYVLEPLASIACTYRADLTGPVEGENTATVETTGKVGGGTATAMVDFGEPTTVTDECIRVEDDLLDPLGTIHSKLGDLCVGDLVDGAHTYRFWRTFGPYGTELCGEEGFDVRNVASFLTTDTGATGEDDHVIHVTVPCPPVGCTLTQGYWKTHSEYGPAPYDEIWDRIGEDTTFYLSGLSYYGVMWTPPKGNPYLTLAHQFIAAKLNILAGADPTAITVDPNDVMSAVEALFTNHTPSALVGKTTSAKMLRSKFQFYGQVLDEYNSGLRGPGHCSE